MSSRADTTFSLAAEHAAYIAAQVASGAYASDDAGLHAALQSLREREDDVERWLRDAVGPVYDAMRADPSRALSARSAFQDVRAHHAARTAEET